MRIIHEANKGVMKIWRGGRPQNTPYRLLRYVISSETEGGMLLYNVITGELVFLDEYEMKNVSGLPCCYAPWMDELISKHFIVRCDADEKKTVDTLRAALNALNRSDKLTSYVILPTSYCNARCFYCYESGAAHINMTEETAVKAADYIESTCKDASVDIQWFGGEPMLGVARINQICELLQEKGIEYSSSMISNGYLFTKELATRAKKVWKLNWIQITLDGTENVYRKTKDYVNPCDDPLSRVLDNIEFLQAEEINVQIRMNLGMHNYEDLTELIKVLDRRFTCKDHIQVYSNILFDNAGEEPVHFEKDEMQILEERHEELAVLAVEAGFSKKETALPVLKLNRCMADGDSMVVILPDGSIGKCEHYLDEKHVGHIETGITDKAACMQMKEHAMYDFCDRCPMFPDCIRLKICEAMEPCSEKKAKKLIERHKKQLIRRYERYLHGENDTTEETGNDAGEEL